MRLLSFSEMAPKTGRKFPALQPVYTRYKQRYIERRRSRGISKLNLPGYRGFFQCLRNFRQRNACEQAELILQAAWPEEESLSSAWTILIFYKQREIERMSLTVAQLSCILLHPGISSSWVMWQMFLERYPCVLMESSPTLLIHFLKICRKQLSL
jgi:hypothetical protein